MWKVYVLDGHRHSPLSLLQVASICQSFVEVQEVGSDPKTLRSYLWSPKRNANGAKNPFYEFMREVAPDDLIFSLVDSNAAVLYAAPRLLQASVSRDSIAQAPG